MNMDAVAWGEMRVVDLGGFYPDRDPTFVKKPDPDIT